MLGSILLLAALQGAQTVRLESGARDPAWSADGRLAVSLRGDLWVMRVSADGGVSGAEQLTRGPAWDREPAWSVDGEWLVFTSDRAGDADIWRLRADGAGAPERLTTSSEPETEPSVGTGGTILYVRGAGAFADVWERQSSGATRRLTSQPGADRSPAISSQGALAWIREQDGLQSLRVRSSAMDTASERTLVDDRPIGVVEWSANGERLAFTSVGRTSGVWVIGRNGGRPVPVTEDGSAVAWSPDGLMLAVATFDPVAVGYNGDPDRLGDRVAGDVQDGAGQIRVVAAPAPPQAGTALDAGLNAAGYNAAAYDRVWDRIARLYFGANGAIRSPEGDPPAGLDARLAEWWRVGDRHRPAAMAATDAAALDAAIQAMLNERPPARAPASGRAAVSSAHPLATAAGTEILAAGGNVVDAAIAVSFAIGVVEPDASGIGGYGEMLIHLDGMAAPAAIEFMTRVPQEATLDNPALRELPPDGPVLANVPGTVAGMGLAWRKYGSGKVSWARILEPAIRIAENGFILDEAFATTLRREYDAFAKYESSRTLFFRDGQPLEAGDTLRNPDLASTLRQIADGGADEFYSGDVGRRIAADLNANGNPVTHADFARYFAAERTPVTTTYRGHTIFSGPPPVTGGVGLVSKLNLLELADPGSSITKDAEKLHAMIEAWKLQPSTGGRIADPDSWPVDISPFESKDTARARWTCYAPDRASMTTATGDPRDCSVTSQNSSRDSVSPAVESCPEHAPITPECRSTGTTAFAVADAQGNMVAVTQTLGTWGGNFYVSPGLGFLYNDKMRSFRTDPDAYGARIPYARVTTSIAPTLVFRGTGTNRQPLLAVGAAGNAWIGSAVYETVVGVIDHGLGPQEALEQPRFLPGGRGPGGTTTIQIEDAFDPAAIRALEAMGHSFRRISLRGELRMGYGAAVLVRDAQAIAGADPRRSGAAGAVR